MATPPGAIAQKRTTADRECAEKSYKHGPRTSKPRRHRQTEMKLPSMYYRRARGDIIEVYNYIHGQYIQRRGCATPTG